MPSKNFWKTLKKPIVGLAPMDGYSDSAFRRVCKSINPHIITVTEFTSAEGLSHKAKKLLQKLWFHPNEQPIIAQIFGKNTESFVKAAKIITDLGFSGIDLNMGCPAKKVIRSEQGMFLRKDPKHAFDLVYHISKATPLPISVKTRLGWEDSRDLIEFGKGVESAGANMICIHARTYTVPYKCEANIPALKELKDALSIPVLGNGGIHCMQDGYQKCHFLDGFLIGQATFGNPWVFDEKQRHLADIPIQEKLQTIKNHATWLVEHKGERVGTQEIRKHLLLYLKHIKYAKHLKKYMQQVNTLNEIFAILNSI